MDRKPPDPNIFFLTLSKIADLPTPFRVSAESKNFSALSELKNIEYLFYFLYCFKKIPKLCFISLKICGKYANFANRKCTLTTRYRVLASKFPQIFIFVKRDWNAVSSGKFQWYTEIAMTHIKKQNTQFHRFRMLKLAK